MQRVGRLIDSEKMRHVRRRGYISAYLAQDGNLVLNTSFD